MRLHHALLIVLMLGGAAAPAGVQQDHDHAGGVPSGGHQRVQAYLDEFDAVIGSGRGFGLAFAADQNGYPGPMHVLELKDLLRLTPEQEARAQRLMHAMFAESRPTSARLLEAEARLRAVFASGAANEARVRVAVADVERARSEVRLVHLLIHLETRDLLTEAQRRAYHEARWPGR